MSRRDIIADRLLTVCSLELCLPAVLACGCVFAVPNLPINTASGLIFPLVKLNVICLLHSAEKKICGLSSPVVISSGSNQDPTVRETKLESALRLEVSSGENERVINGVCDFKRELPVSTGCSSGMVSLLNSSVEFSAFNSTRRCSSNRFNVK